MNNLQKGIKAAAICFAIFLIITICSGILSGLYFFTRITGISKPSRNQENSEELVSEITEIVTGHREMDIKVDLKATNLIIKKGGEKFEVKVDDKENFRISNNNKTLKIEEKDYFFFDDRRFGNVEIIIPNGISLRDITISIGGGNTSITGINAEKLKIEQGAGKLTILASEFNETKISGGAGETSIGNSILHNLKLESGVGKVGISGQIIGNSKIECGIGEVDLKLEGKEEDYKINVEKGIGSIKIKDNEQSNNISYGSGENTIKIEGRNRKCKSRLWIKY